MVFRSARERLYWFKTTSLQPAPAQTALWDEVYLELRTEEITQMGRCAELWPRFQAFLHSLPVPMPIDGGRHPDEQPAVLGKFQHIRGRKEFDTVRRGISEGLQQTCGNQNRHVGG